MPELLTPTAPTPTSGQAAPTAGSVGAPPAQAGAPAIAQTTPGQQPAQPAQSPDPAGKPQGEPVRYEFKSPEGMTYDPAVLKALAEVSGKHKLTPESAQAVLDEMSTVISRRQAEQMAAANEAWAEEARTDKEIGGDKLNETLAKAKRALDVYGSPKLREFLKESPLRNNAEFLRLLSRVGATVSEDRVLASGADGGVTDDLNTRAGQARRLYGDKPPS